LISWWLAHARSGIAMTAIACELGLSVSQVTRLIAAEEAESKE
jgi:hypothetical protein